MLLLFILSDPLYNMFEDYMYSRIRFEYELRACCGLSGCFKGLDRRKGMTVRRRYAAG